MLSGLLLALLAADPASPVPGVEAPPVRVERRLLLKEQHGFLTAGPTYLARGDYYNNPGLLLSGTWYLTEMSGVELKAGAFLSSLNASATEVFERTGLVPEANRPIALLSVGWRQGLGYGKVLVGGSRVIHFDVQAAAHLGVTLTSRGVSPSPMIGPGLLMRLSPRIHAQLDVPLVVTLEPRPRSLITLGALPSLTVGVVL
ncbi:MAG: hypothetical protein ABW123_01280 [Cystobacter sp.]